MSVEELSDRMVDDEWVSSSQLLDVREDWEHETSFLPHFALRPFSRFPSWGPSAAAKLDPERETVVLCHHGIRSHSVAQFLADQGFKRVFNVSGGIDAYSRIVDPSVPRY
ncbi:unnamed protein product [Ostreobium quekettii]|uniref:Rhodanese domain-containing protein n=1 Tax=Ostreobium quekettii TaxID=121088 RepID=A0A8S1JHS0_9CHLO|nr:unnamed protein product [Ostreobium quekettii]|eukprot:evm.model.scf_2491.3 EVM.evm.TU.scf_2491.3   scf_2491:14134-15142(+)